MCGTLAGWHDFSFSYASNLPYAASSRGYRSATTSSPGIRSLLGRVRPDSLMPDDPTTLTLAVSGYDAASSRSSRSADASRLPGPDR